MCFALKVKQKLSGFCKRIVGMCSVFRKVLVYITKCIHPLGLSKSIPGNCALTMLSQLLRIFFIMAYETSEKQQRNIFEDLRKCKS